MVQWVRSLLFVGQIYFMMPVIGLIFAPWAIFSRDGARACCKAYSRWVFWTARFMVGIKVEVRGTEHIPEGAAIVTAKHQSFLDVMMIFTALPQAKFIMKREIMWTPVIGLYAIRLDCVAVERGKKGKAIAGMLARVADGTEKEGQLIIYPQGTRVSPGADMPYKSGTGVLYEQMDQPVVPVAVNVGVLWPRKGIIRNPGVATVEFLPPIPAGLARADMMARLENVVETRSNELMAEIGFDGAR